MKEANLLSVSSPNADRALAPSNEVSEGTQIAARQVSYDRKENMRAVAIPKKAKRSKYSTRMLTQSFRRPLDWSICSKSKERAPHTKV